MNKADATRLQENAPVMKASSGKIVDMSPARRTALTMVVATTTLDCVTVPLGSSATVVNVKGVHWTVPAMGCVLMAVASVTLVTNTETATPKYVNATALSMGHVSMALVSAI